MAILVAAEAIDVTAEQVAALVKRLDLEVRGLTGTGRAAGGSMAV